MMKDLILYLYSTLLRVIWSIGSSSEAISIRNIYLLEEVQRSALKHLSSENGLKELRLLSFKKKSLIAAFQHLNLGRDFSEGHIVIGQGELALK